MVTLIVLKMEIGFAEPHPGTAHDLTVSTPVT